jgi:hypothetical protein
MNTGIEMSLKQIASRAWSERLTPDVHKTARGLTKDRPIIIDKVKAIVDHIVDWSVKGHNDPRAHGPQFDADDAVLVAATMCLAVGIRCRIVGARKGKSWTCWLEYQDGDQWVTVDVLGGVPVGADEQIVVECDEVANVAIKVEVESNADRLAKRVYDLLSSNRPPNGALGVDLVRPPNPKHGHAIAVLFADGKDVVIRFEEQGGKR